MLSAWVKDFKESIREALKEGDRELVCSVDEAAEAVLQTVFSGMSRYEILDVLEENDLLKEVD